ncbi:MAG: GspE/PulE family protein [Candidatus Jacksonbacteria bacterium]
MYTIPQIEKVLLKENMASKQELPKHLKAADSKGQFLLDYLVEKKIVNEEAVYEALARFTGKPFVNLKDKNIRQDILFLIPEMIAKTHDVIAYNKGEDGVLRIAAVDPDDIQTFEFIEKKNRMPVEIALTTPSGIKESLRLYHQNLETEFKSLGDYKSEFATNGENLKKLATDLPIIRLVNSMLESAIFEKASDIHIEPHEHEVNVRYRIDGILRKVMNLPRNVYSGIVARIKILANLKLDEHRLPQDGRFKIADENYQISFRVSIIPVFDGEKIVMRLLDESNQLLNLEDLGFREKDLKKIKTGITKSYGMILVTGPTGSGKSTTLYAILNQLNVPEVNITTIEDPIEYRMHDINQSQINPKINFTFATGLRALLRQDPDIIMVGEIRDQETAEIAIHSAMTGHKVLSTLHTNDASGTLPRLLDMGIVPFLIASTVNMIIAQRLVRKICPHCIMSYNLAKEAMADLSDQLDIKEFIRVLMEEGAIEPAQKNISRLLFFKGKGCKRCGESGYKGRLGIYEIMEITDEIKNLIISKASASQIRKFVQEKKLMSSMLEDGLVKAKAGVTTIEEVLRVMKE